MEVKSGRAAEFEKQEVERSVPVIDLGGVVSGGDPELRKKTINQILEACKTWGTFLVINHGMERAVLEGAREQAMQVFSLPMEQKLKAQRVRDEFAGYGNAAGSKDAHTANFGVESFRLRLLASDVKTFSEKLWSAGEWKESKDFRENFEAYISESSKLSKVIMELLKEGLPEIDRPHFGRYFSKACVGSLRPNYYPISDERGLPSHTDVAAMVLLHQADGCCGLQVEKDSMWVSVPARSDAFVVLMGTVCQILTNDDYKAVRHRAIKGGHYDRLSMVFSTWPDPEIPMTPFPTFLTNRKSPIYRALTFSEFWEIREADVMNPLNCILVDKALTCDNVK